MQTVQLDIKDDELDLFLSIVKKWKPSIVENIRIKDDALDIKPLKKNSIDYVDLQNIKAQKNKQYNLGEAKKILNF